MKTGAYTVIQNPHMLDRVFTKKQTRKFKNRRWVKKYEKKYSYMTPSKNVMISEINKVIFAHPATCQALEVEMGKKEIPKATPITGNSEFGFMPRFGLSLLNRPESILSCCAS